MFGLDVVGIGIGLIVVYLLLSLVCTAISEILAGFFNSRARTLRQGIEKLFADTGFSGFEKEFFDHSLIRSLAEGRAGPSYIPSDRFSRTMLDLISRNAPGEGFTMERVEAGAAVRFGTGPSTGDDGSEGEDAPAAADSPIQQTLRVLVGRAEGDFAKLEKEIEDWFDSAMTRVSAWYKKKTHRILLLVAILVAAATNADTLTIVDSLGNNQALRDALVAQAELYVEQGQPAANLQANINELKGLGVPVGWEDGWPAGLPAGMQKVLGLLITALALSLGAPFWFDLLQKAVTIRSVGRSPQEEAAKRSPGPQASA